MKKVLSKVLAIALAAICVAGFAACGGGSGSGSASGEKITIAVPNDTTNEARALMLLESLGLIKLKDGAGITATIMDIAENPHNIELKQSKCRVGYGEMLFWPAR